MPRKWTFQQPKLRAWIEARLEGEVLNLFGGVVRLTPPHGFACIHNELREDLDADLHRDAMDLTAWVNSPGRFGTVVFDPPYSAHQAVVSYGNRRQQQISHARDVVEYVLRPGGRVISLGYNTTGLGAGRGFRKEDLLIINHGGSHNDTLVLSERRNA